MTINTVYDISFQSVSWYLQLQLIRNRRPPWKHVSNSIDKESVLNQTWILHLQNSNTETNLFFISTQIANSTEPLSPKNPNVRFFPSLPIPFLCPSCCRMSVLNLNNEHIVALYDFHVTLLKPTTVTKFYGQPFQRDVKYKCTGIAIFLKFISKTVWHRPVVTM